MTNKSIIFGVVLMLLVLPVALGAQGEGSNQDRTQTQDRTQDQIQDPIQDRDQIQDRDRIQDQDRVYRFDTTQEQLRIPQQSFEQEQERLRQQLTRVDEQQKEQVQVRTQAQIAAEHMYWLTNRSGDCPQAFCSLIDEHRASVQNQERLEEQIQSRSAWYRMFAGTDRQAVRQLEQERIQNQERIEHMRMLLDECDCDEQVRQQMREWIQVLEQEQNRVGQVVNTEQERRYLFRWW